MKLNRFFLLILAAAIMINGKTHAAAEHVTTCDEAITAGLKPVGVIPEKNQAFIDYLKSLGPHLFEGEEFSTSWDEYQSWTIKPYAPKDVHGNITHIGFVIKEKSPSWRDNRYFYVINLSTREVLYFSKEEGVQDLSAAHVSAPFGDFHLSEPRKIIAEGIKKYLTAFSDLKDVSIEKLFIKRKPFYKLAPRTFNADVEVDMRTKNIHNLITLGREGYEIDPTTHPKAHAPLLNWFSTNGFGKPATAKPEEANFYAESWGARANLRSN